MCFIHFTVTQNGKLIGSSAVMEQAVKTAQSCARETGRPVSVLAHIDGGGTREVVFNPDGTNEKIWLIDKGRPLAPTIGQTYTNRGGGEYRCLTQLPTGTLYHHQAGGSSATAGLSRTTFIPSRKSGWMSSMTASCSISPG